MNASFRGPETMGRRSVGAGKSRVNWSLADGVAVVELGLGHNQGLVDYDTACALCEVAEEIEWNSAVRLVLLWSTGPHFCLGTVNEDAWPAPLPWVESVASLSAPVVGAVRGGAVSEGCELALACDLRWVHPDAFFQLRHLAEGRLPRHGGTQRLPRSVGRLRALELLWTARRVAAAEAVRIGLASRMLAARRWRNEARRLCGEMARLAPLALRYGKEAVGKGLDLTLEQGLRLEEDLYVLLQTTRDRAEGIRAFRQHRRPRFRGE